MQIYIFNIFIRKMFNKQTVEFTPFCIVSSVLRSQFMVLLLLANKYLTSQTLYPICAFFYFFILLLSHFSLE